MNYVDRFDAERMARSSAPDAAAGGALLARLIRSDQAEAEGHCVRSSSPVLALCRKLIEAGCDPDRPLHAYRGDTLCLTVRSIGEGAVLRARGNGVGFEIAPEETRPAAPPMRQNETAAPL